MTVRDLFLGEINARRIKARKERCGVKFRGEIQTFCDKFYRVFLKRGFVGLNLMFPPPHAPSLAADRALLREALLKFCSKASREQNEIVF